MDEKKAKYVLISGEDAAFIELVAFFKGISKEDYIAALIGTERQRYQEAMGMESQDKKPSERKNIDGKTYKIKEVAKKLKVSTNTVYRKIERGEIPAVEIMGVKYIFEEDLKSFIDKNVRYL